MDMRGVVARSGAASFPRQCGHSAVETRASPSEHDKRQPYDDAYRVRSINGLHSCETAIHEQFRSRIFSKSELRIAQKGSWTYSCIALV